MSLGRLGAFTFRILILWLVCGNPRIAYAHPSGLQVGDAWWLAWHLDPLVAANLLLWTLFYGLGLVHLWRRVGIGRVVAVWRATAFFASMFVIGFALLSPLDTLSDDLSWVHMTQHMTLMVVAAPLLILGAPGLVFTWALPRSWKRATSAGCWKRSSRWRRALRSFTWNPLCVWTLHALTLWIWHFPSLYELALVNPLVHDVEHLAFFLASCLFWRMVVDMRKHCTLNPGLAVLYLFTTSLHAMVLGVLMALSPFVWYPIYLDRTVNWGLNPLEDQQIAGLIMWMPACLVYAVAAATLFGIWINELDFATSQNCHEEGKVASLVGPDEAVGQAQTRTDFALESDKILQ